MKIGTLLAAGTAAVCLFTQAGLAQRVMQLDLNNLGYMSLNAAGGQIPFGGVSHTGSFWMMDTLPITQLVDVAMSSGNGVFASQPGPWNLTDAEIRVDLVNGQVTGGIIRVDINGGPGVGGDRYTAAIAAVGHVSTFVGGGFLLEALSVDGAFSDAAWGPVAIADFFASQGTSPFLQGSFLTFKIQPDANGAGFSDTDIWISAVPTPGTLACGFLAAALMAGRRRR
jgi:hypothetical protein